MSDAFPAFLDRELETLDPDALPPPPVGPRPGARAGRGARQLVRRRAMEAGGTRRLRRSPGLGRLPPHAPHEQIELVADQAAHPPFGTNLTYPLDATCACTRRREPAARRSAGSTRRSPGSGGRAAGASCCGARGSVRAIASSSRSRSASSSASGRASRARARSAVSRFLAAGRIRRSVWPPSRRSARPRSAARRRTRSTWPRSRASGHRPREARRARDRSRGRARRRDSRGAGPHRGGLGGPGLRPRGHDRDGRLRLRVRRAGRSARERVRVHRRGDRPGHGAARATRASWC